MKFKVNATLSVCTAILLAATAVFQINALQLPGANPASVQESATSGSYSGTSATVRSQQDFVKKWKQFEKIQVSSVFDASPSVVSPYGTGRLNPVFLNKGEQYFNFLRYAAGLSDIKLTDTLGTRAQHGAVLLAANNILTHSPSKPSGMDDQFYKEGSASASSSNISMRYGYDEKSMLQDSLQGCVDDNSSIDNLLVVGHRQWMLSPRLLNTGFGYAKNAKGYSYITTQAMDKSAPVQNYYFISWPAQGEFPNNVITSDTPWSVTLNPQKYQRPNLNDVKVEVVRRSDGRTWSLSKSDYKAQPDKAQPYFNVDPSGRGEGSCIIFHLGASNFKSRTYNDSFTVKVTGIKAKDGTAAELSYPVNIFDFNKALSGGTETTGGKGDVNQDGKISVDDVLTLQRYLAGSVTLDARQQSSADTNNDAGISLMDVILIQKYIAQEISSFD